MHALFDELQFALELPRRSILRVFQPVNQAVAEQELMIPPLWVLS